VGGLLPSPPTGLTVLLALAAPAPAAASDTVPIRVEFDAPAGCSSADTFYGGLLARMSRARRAAPGEAAVHFNVRLTRTGNKVRGELRLMDGSPGDGDTRRVEGETCDAVVEVLSLTAALALVTRPAAPIPPPPPARPPPPPPASRSSASSSSQSSSSSSQSSSSSSGKSPAPDNNKPPETEEKPPPPDELPATVTILPSPTPPEPPRGAHYELGLQAVAADVISTAVNVGGGLALRFEKNSAGGAGASLGLTFLYASNDLLQSPDEIAAQWFALAATGCPGWSVGRTITLQPCAQAIGGWLAASGRGLTNPSSVGRSWFSAGALVRADAHLGAGFSVELEAGASIPIARRRFIVTTPEGTVGETPTVAPIVTLGLSRSL